jgi:hypothetical protein
MIETSKRVNILKIEEKAIIAEKLAVVKLAV